VTGPAITSPWLTAQEAAASADPAALRREAAHLRAIADRLVKLAAKAEQEQGVDRVAEIRESVRQRLSRSGALDD
jgi:hypothetical protein